ncbi:MAG: glutamate synthase central domain-containing protein [Hyphomicrobium sp.]
MKGDLDEKLADKEIVKRYIKAVDKGILKVMSKMGISTYQSYCGAQIFDAIGLSTEFVRKFFYGTATTIEGAGLAEIAEETARRHPRRLRQLAGAREHPRGGRRLCLPPARRGPRLDLRHGARLAARRARQLARQVPGLCAYHQ